MGAWLLGTCLGVPVLSTVLIALSAQRPLWTDTINIVAPFLSLFAFILFVLTADIANTTIVLLPIVGDIAIAFSAEPLGLVFAGLVCALWPVSSLYAMAYMQHNRLGRTTSFYAYYSLAIGSALGIAFSDNLLTLFIFYEVLTFSTYPLVSYQRSPEALRAGRLYLATLVGTSTILLLTAIVWIWSLTGTLDFVIGGILEGYANRIQTTLLLLLVVFGTAKAAIIPFHQWLPSAMVAPVPVSALLHAVAVVKAGVFTIMKLMLYVFGVDFLSNLGSSDWLIYLASLTIIVSAIIATRQTHLKKLLAYSTISQLSYVVLGMAMLHPLALLGAVMHVLAHGFAKITLFFGAGAIYTANKLSRVDQINGIASAMPWTMGLFALASLSLIGLPPLVGFRSKWFLLEGAASGQMHWVAVVLIISSLLSAIYLLPLIHRAFFRHRETKDTKHTEAPLAMRLAMLFPVVMCFVLFFYGDPLSNQLQVLYGGESSISALK